jgi:signal recognition particle receptor subunit beta
MRLKECAEELMSLLAETDLAKVPLLVFANKQDLQFALDADSVMESLKLMDISDRTWNIQACSAYSKEGLGDGMEWLIKTISAAQSK